MANVNTLGARVQHGTEAAIAVIEKYGTEERKQRIHNGFYGRIPMANRDPLASAAITAEIMGGLAEIIERLAKEQNASAATTKKETEN